MGETTVRPTNPAADQKDRHISTWISIASALTAVVAALISGFQVNLASREHADTEYKAYMDAKEKSIKVTNDPRSPILSVRVQLLIR